MIFWRGERFVNAPPPLVRAPSSRKRSAPGNTPAPKLSSTVNRPLVTPVAVLVSVLLTCVPALTAFQTLKVRS